MCGSSASEAVADNVASGAQRVKLTGRAFYESIGSPRMVVAPMVDRSEFAWRMLSRSFIRPEETKTLLAYSPMLHSRLFRGSAKFRDSHFEPTRSSLVDHDPSESPPWLDGNPELDRPLIVQFCANDPEHLLEAAKYVAPHCDAVDLNLGCPQGIARSGHYGAFLQEDWDVIYRLINKLHQQLSIPVTAKIRILETQGRTLEYAKMVLSAGASILTVHGRRREQKGHNMGLADWSCIKYLRENLPPDTVIFANGNVLNRHDLQPCLDATGADGVMSAEGNLSDPSIFAPPPSPKNCSPDYWRGQQGQEGYRIDGMIRRYFDIIYRYILEKPPPQRRPLFNPSNPAKNEAKQEEDGPYDDVDTEPPKKRQKRGAKAQRISPSLKYMQGHLFQLLRPILSTHTEIRDGLSRCRIGDMAAFERILTMIEHAVKEALVQYPSDSNVDALDSDVKGKGNPAAKTSENATIHVNCKLPWWICQPYIRPLPEEARESGALAADKKEDRILKEDEKNDSMEKGATEVVEETQLNLPQNELSKEALVCG